MRRAGRRAVIAASIPYNNHQRKDYGASHEYRSHADQQGQTTIPKPIRDSLRMKAGDRMSFTLMPDGVVLMRVKNKRVSGLAGRLYKKGRKPVPIELLSR